jgi:hypothetical protein
MKLVIKESAGPAASVLLKRVACHPSDRAVRVRVVQDAWSGFRGRTNAVQSLVKTTVGDGLATDHKAEKLIKTHRNAVTQANDRISTVDIACVQY